LQELVSMHLGKGGSRGCGTIAPRHASSFDGVKWQHEPKGAIKAVQDPAPVRAFRVANVGGGAPVYLVSLGVTRGAPHARRYLPLRSCSR
jgi:hypothetical protein